MAISDVNFPGTYDTQDTVYRGTLDSHVGMARLFSARMNVLLPSSKTMAGVRLISIIISQVSGVVFWGLGSNDVFFLLLLLLSQHRPSGKNRIVYQLLSQPHKHLRHGKLKYATHGSDKRLTAPVNPSNVPVSNTV